MYELKNIQRVIKFLKTNGLNQGINEYYKVNTNKKLRAVDKRVKEIPNEYKNKAIHTDEKFGLPGSSAVQLMLRNYSTVKGLAVGAFGELSNSFNEFIQGAAFEGALNKENFFFGPKNVKAAEGVINWYLRRRWSRTSLILAAESRYHALKYVGGSAQWQAAQIHARFETDDDFRFEAGRRERDKEAQFHRFRH